MQQFFEKSSPFAYQDMTARMVETVRKGYWKADAATTKKLLEEYVDSVNEHGVGCAEHTCGNPRLQKYVMEQAVQGRHSGAGARGFQRGDGEGHRRGGRRRAPNGWRASPRENDAKMAARLEAVPAPSRAISELEGYVMEEGQQAEQKNDTRDTGAPSQWAPAVASLPVLGLLLAWRWRRRRA